MAVRTHYDVLGVANDASPETIRTAYRRLAREHHPDQRGGSAASSAAGGRTMPEVNEAYRVLHDPGRRALYDRSLGTTRRVAAAADANAGRPTSGRQPHDVESSTVGFAGHRGPARVPWRMLLFSGSIAIAGVVALAQFTGSGEPLGPDGILRSGDCVEIEANTDAREVACSGSGDLVVRALVPFDGTCPGFTAPHRDRQGMGVACVELVEGG